MLISFWTAICFSSIACSRSTRADVVAPLHGLVGHAERAEDVVVEAVLAEQQLVDPLQEQPRLGALDDPVVVGRGDRDDLREPEVGEDARIGALELRPGSRGADADDEALARHQARHRLDGADRARVGEADRGAREVVGESLLDRTLRIRSSYDAQNPRKSRVSAFSDARHHQRAAAVASSRRRPRGRVRRARGGPPAACRRHPSRNDEFITGTVSAMARTMA